MISLTKIVIESGNPGQQPPVILGLESLDFLEKNLQRFLTRGSNILGLQIHGSKKFYRFSSKNEEFLSPRMTVLGRPGSQQPDDRAPLRNDGIWKQASYAF